MASSMHNTRLLRFLIVLTIVVLTIFIYTSYSSTQTLTPPPMRSAASLVALYSTQTNHSSNTNELDSSAANSYDSNNKVPNANTIDAAHKSFIYHANLPHPSLGGSHGNEMVFIKKLIHHREPTIDVNAIDDGGGGGGIEGGVDGQGSEGRSLVNAAVDENAADELALERFNNNNDLLQEEQYVQAVDNTLGNINNSVTSAASGVGTGGLASSDTNQQLKQQHQQQLTSDQLPSQQQDQQITADTNNSNNNLNKIPESDVLIPTSNLQKFIESADKILKNITVVQQPPSSVAPADNVNKSGDKDEIPQPPLADGPNETKQLVEDEENDEALPPSVIMTIKGAGGATVEKTNEPKQPPVAAASSSNTPKVTSTTKKVPKVAAADPTQGIPTKQIYESGHMNEEIDINQICPNKGDKLKLLILITSAQTHAEARLSIRQTWGHYGTRRDVSTAFILGRTTNATVSEALTQENMIYGDLIRGHFIDSYNNLTLKTLSSLEWVDQNCPKVKYILKTDDDMFINVPKLLQFLDAHAKDKRVIYGRLAKKWKPIRNKKSKYYISTGQFGATVFPPFTTGPAYVMTGDIVHELYESSLEQLYLKLEDVFTTGIVAQKLGVKRVHDNMFLNRRIAFNPCNIRKAISVHMIKPNEQFDLWKKLLDQTTKCK
ncbi:3-galactosyltransferase 5, Beta-1 [Lucilia cuprina]|nr:3-galactosyltransferase 5, Beta-1 [Lucilia cuprina]KAI8125051.1 3-galactosyltransferase 5, Beta-1 [Lucilia cuprina]